MKKKTNCGTQIYLLTGKQRFFATEYRVARTSVADLQQDQKDVAKIF